MTIESIKEISELIKLAEGDFSLIKDELESQADINVRLYDGNFIQLNYNFEAEMNNRWNWLERNSRGMIFDIHDGSLVALPFAKFFNWGQRNTTTNAEIDEILIKEDGSCGITFYDKYKDLVRVATRGSLESDQAIWGTKWANENLDVDKLKDVLTQDMVTPIFEIVYPENRIVVDYEGYEGMILLASRSRLTGAYLSHEFLTLEAENIGCKVVEKIEGKTVESILKELETLPMNNEGFVVKFKDGLWAKFKGAAYLHAHRLIADLSQKRVNELYSLGQHHIDDYLNILPDEFHDEFNEYLDNIVKLAEHEMTLLYDDWHYMKSISKIAEFGRTVQTEASCPKYLTRILFDWKKGTKNWSSDEIMRYIASKQK